MFREKVSTATGGLRVEMDASSERMQKKIRNAQVQKIPYMLVVGDNEVAQETISLRHRSGADLGSVKLDQLLSRMVTEIHSRQDTPI